MGWHKAGRRLLFLAPSAAAAALALVLAYSTTNLKDKLLLVRAHLGPASLWVRLIALALLTQAAVIPRVRRRALAALARFDRVGRRPGAIAVVAVALAVAYVAFKIAQQLAIQTHAGDLAVFDLALSNTLRGAFMYTPIPSEVRGCLYAMHYYAALVLLLPFYRLWDSPYVLLVAQGLVVSLAAVPLWLIVKTELRSGFLALAMALSFATSVYTVDGLSFDFHPEMAVPLFLFSAFAAYLRGRLAWYALFALLAAMCREDVAVYLAAWGVYLALVRRDVKVGVITAALGLLYAAVAVKVLIPLFSPCGETRSRLIAERYAPYGRSAPGIVVGLLTHPLRVARDLCKRPTFMILLRVLGLPLAAPTTALMWGPPLLAARTTTTEGMRGLRLYASAPILPFLYLGAVWGLRGLCARWPRRRWEILAGAGCLLLVANFGHWRPVQITPRAAVGRRLARSIPAAASVMATYDLVPQLPRRARSHLWGVYIAVDQPPDPRIVDYAFFDLRGNPFPLTRAGMRAFARRWRESGLYDVVEQKAGFLLLRRKGLARISHQPGTNLSEKLFFESFRTAVTRWDAGQSADEGIGRAGPSGESSRARLRRQTGARRARARLRPVFLASAPAWTREKCELAPSKR